MIATGLGLLDAPLPFIPSPRGGGEAFGKFPSDKRPFIPGGRNGVMLSAMTTPTKRRTRGRKRAESKRDDLNRTLGQGVKAAAKAGRAREAVQLADALARHRAARSEAAAARRLRHERSPERRAEEQALKDQFNQEVDRLVEQRIRERLQAKGVDPRPFLRG